MDVILERPHGALVAVEIKATSSPIAAQLKSVAWLRDKVDRSAPGSFRAGVLLHTGTVAAKMGDRLHVVPISALWPRPQPA